MTNTYYYCYSYPQKKYLIDEHQFCVIKGMHPKTHKQYWVFERNDTLDRLLNQWSAAKK